MPILRKFQKIFGINANASDISVVGSKNANNPQYSKDLDTIQSLSNWETGMRAIVTNSNAPYLQDHNALFYVITSQLAYLFQSGIAEWDSQTDYFAGKSVVLKSGKIYLAIADNTNIEPEVTSGWDTKWICLTDWLLKGVKFNSSFGYPKGARILYQGDTAKFYIESLYNNNIDTPDETNIYYSKRVKKVKKLLNNGETPSEAASYSNVGQIYLVKGTGAYSPYYASTGYICVDNNGVYSWELKNVSELFDNQFGYQQNAYLEDKDDYLYFYGPNILVPLSSQYRWIYVNPIPETSKMSIVKFYNDGNGNWYKEYSNGYVEIKGKLVGGNSGDYTVTFPIEMADIDYDITITPINTNGASGQTNNYIKELSTTGMKISMGQPTTSICWSIEGLKKGA